MTAVVKRPDPAKFAALAAGQAAAVAHLAAHDLGAAAYAIRAVGTSASAGETEAARIREREWQRERLPAEVRELVRDDQRSRSPIAGTYSTTDIGPSSPPTLIATDHSGARKPTHLRSVEVRT
jgi:hypothetical protein